jgi:anti-sigma regulatory factor (Ser/Thr protein kinase)
MIVGDELISNIIKHGYGTEKGDILLRLLFNEETNEFYLTIIDHAKPFNQLSVENQALTGTEVPTQVGGLGIFIVKQIMTECAYDRVNGRNILVLKKRFESPL